MKKTDNSFYFSGKTIFGSSKTRLLKFLKKALIEENGLKIVFTPNPEQLVLAEENPEFDRILKQADILIPDGVGIAWSSNILADHKSNVITETIPGRFVVTDLLAVAQKENLKVLLIGGKDYSADGGIVVNGQPINWTEGYLDATHPTKGEEEVLTRLIKELKPELVFVAFGAPKQEKWLIDHQELLKKSGVKVAMVVGGSFDYLLGKVPTPPSFISSIGLEWLFRLVTQPWRLKRQLKLIKFIFIVLGKKLSKTAK